MPEVARQWKKQKISSIVYKYKYNISIGVYIYIYNMYNITFMDIFVYMAGTFLYHLAVVFHKIIYYTYICIYPSNLQSITYIYIYVSNFQNLRNRRYCISGHQVSRSVSKSSGTIGSTRKNDTYIVYRYTCEMHKHDVAYCHTLQTLIF